MKHFPPFPAINYTNTPSCMAFCPTPMSFPTCQHQNKTCSRGDSFLCRFSKSIPSITSKGSMTLPKLLDIFLPWASRTIALGNNLDDDDDDDDDDDNDDAALNHHSESLVPVEILEVGGWSRNEWTWKHTTLALKHISESESKLTKILLCEWWDHSFPSLTALIPI